jgi:hypothetical protein
VSPVHKTDIAEFDRLIRVCKLDPYTLQLARRLRNAINLMPMWVVLDQVPGDTVTEQANIVGVSRNTWYGWRRGEIRPNKVQSIRLTALTGIPADKFRGIR